MKKKFSTHSVLSLFVELFVNVLCFTSIILTISGIAFPDSGQNSLNIGIACLFLFVPALAARQIGSRTHKLFHYIAITAASTVVVFFLWFFWLFAAITLAVTTLLMFAGQYRSKEQLSMRWTQKCPLSFISIFFVEFLIAGVCGAEFIKPVLGIFAFLYLLCHIYTKNKIEMEEANEIGKSTVNFSAKRMRTINTRLMVILLAGGILAGTGAVLLDRHFPLPTFATGGFRYSTYSPPSAIESEELPDETEEDIMTDEEVLAIMSGNVKPNPFFLFIDAILRAITIPVLVAILIGGTIIGTIGATLRLRIKKSRKEVTEMQEHYAEVIITDPKPPTKKAKRLDFSPNAVIRRRFKKTIEKKKPIPKNHRTPAELLTDAGYTLPDAIFDPTSDKEESSSAKLLEIYEKARYSQNGCTRQDISQFEKS